MVVTPYGDTNLGQHWLRLPCFVAWLIIDSVLCHSHELRNMCSEVKLLTHWAIGTQQYASQKKESNFNRLNTIYIWGYCWEHAKLFIHLQHYSIHWYTCGHQGDRWNHSQSPRKVCIGQFQCCSGNKICKNMPLKSEQNIQLTHWTLEDVAVILDV